MELGIEGRVALVTGASQGIALAIATELAREGARVAISSRSRERIEAAAGPIGALPLVHDSNDVDRAPKLVDAVEESLGPVEILVASTGGPPPGEPLGLAREQWRAAYDTLVLTPIALVERVVPGMRDRGFGRIVNVSSYAAREPIPALILSNAHRSGLLGALKTLARELAGAGITINSVLPGRIATARLADSSGSLEAAARAASDQVPAGRLGTVEEMAAAATFLCSARASYVTGTALRVDGGLSHAV